MRLCLTAETFGCRVTVSLFLRLCLVSSVFTHSKTIALSPKTTNCELKKTHLSLITYHSTRTEMPPAFRNFIRSSNLLFRAISPPHITKSTRENRPQNIEQPERHQIQREEIIAGNERSRSWPSYYDNSTNYDFSQIDPDLLEAANTLDEHGIPWDLGYCLFCDGASNGPHAYDCPLHYNYPAQVSLPTSSEVQYSGHARGVMETPTLVRTANMASDEVVNAYAPPTQAQQDLLRPTGPIKLNPINFGGRSPDPAASMPTPTSEPDSSQLPDIAPRQQPLIAAPPGQFPYTGRFKSFAEAQSALQAQPTDRIVSLNIKNDDWQLVKNAEYVQDCGARLLAAIQHAPTEAPAIHTNDFSRQYYFDHQANTLTRIFESLQANPLQAEARVLVCIQEVISIHEHGLPEPVMARKSHKQGYKIESKILCSERISKVIHGATVDKYIAHDILTGLNVKDYVRSPDGFLKRKQENCRVNAKKALDKKTLDHGMGKTDASSHARRMTKKGSVGTKGRGERQTSVLPEMMSLPAFGSLRETELDDAAAAVTPNSDFDADVDFEE
ncbi:hypothetical protein AC578_6855 [Pseudocercospora eumusae]|uniref:Uncharacterized protein n=1 Tax=Pseudocercospora eumusae TaxID=321146 RepID=A0A139H7A0_9PEZI|nr:hypothetical protein AC578_6855 [Pseudocercospora eumusae]